MHNLTIFMSNNTEKSSNFFNTSEILVSFVEKLEDAGQNESLYLLQNTTNVSGIYWLNDNSTNNSFSLYNFTNRIYANMTSPLHEMNLIQMLLLTILLGLIILATVVGNVFVIAAVFLERNLQTEGNYLVLSLAVADLMVACLVMPLGAFNEVNNRKWILGPELCEVWTSGDVLCCTASILHLVAIALDRFWAVTSVDYVRQRSGRKIGFMIFLVWAIGFLVSLAPVFGWKDENFLYRIEELKECLVSQDTGYQIFATCSTFYVPLVVILILYWRIYQVARTRIRHKPGAKALRSIQPSESQLVQILPHDQKSSASVQNTETTTSATNGTPSTREVTPMKMKKKTTRENTEAKRERKAAKTLAIITGAFVICWLPFFVMALSMALLNDEWEPNPYMFSIFLWLGYVNSMLNPIIYTIFSPDFRSAFKRVLCGKKSRRP
ncbi:5-hydroxytryptamine receptor-like [Stegodyphus dumicola]|uniref:5-hydroxytryptamine receptor-like n=1 Tax=Stegodyphus dumicola TaxID=202533 RepID=UPI0015B3114E|nr:5-hydroxytryptamine receptor-like [Stegodyphus dumicola]